MKQVLCLIALLFCLPISAQQLKAGRLEGVNIVVTTFTDGTTKAIKTIK